jgi:DNA-directed RNA polymerase subunit RPC12/RpoP
LPTNCLTANECAAAVDIYHLSPFLDRHDLRRFSNGYAEYICTHCGTKKKSPFTCKGRFCTSCGKKYTDEWVERTVGELIDVLYRHLVLTLRSGMKDGYNALLPLRQPGLLAEAAGIEVEEYYALEEPVPVTGLIGNGTGKIWAERLKVKDAVKVVEQCTPAVVEAKPLQPIKCIFEVPLPEK